MAGRIIGASPDQHSGTKRPLGALRCVLIVAVLVLTTEVFAYEFTMVSPSLPNIAAAFRTTSAGLTMTVALLSSAVAVPLLSKLSDIHGKRLLVCAVTAAFVIGSLMCAVATSFPLFLAGRVIESVGLGATVISYGLVRDLLPARWVPIGIGGLGMGFGASAVIGPTVGGWLIDSHGFRSVFWFLLIYSLVMLILLLLVVPESSVRIPHRLDYLGGGLFGLGAAAIITGTSIISLGTLLIPIGVLMLAGFVLYERGRPEPFMPVRLLRRPSLFVTLVCAAMIGFVTGSELVLMPMMLRTPRIPQAGAGALGLTAIQYGVTFAVPMGITAAVSGLLSGWLSRRLGPRNALIIAATGWTLGTALTAAGFAASTTAVGVTAVVMGIGHGFYYAAAANLIIEAVPATFQGVSASMKYTVEQGIGSVATAIAGAVLATSVAAPPRAGHAAVFAMAGFHRAYLLASMVGAVAVVLAILMRHGRTPATGGVAPNAAEAELNQHVAAQPTR